VVELCRQKGIGEQAFYRWKKRFGDLGTAEVRELRRLPPAGDPLPSWVNK
jgi:putative transposase